MWKPAGALPLSSEHRKQLQRYLTNPNTPQKVVLRLRILLGAAEGRSNNQLAQQFSTSRPTVLLWRRRFEQVGLEGVLEDAPRPGRPKRLSPEVETRIVEATLYTKPKHATHWSTRTMARAQGVSAASVQRIWRAYGLQPHRVEHFKLSTDPRFVAKVRDIVGLYWNPPEHALVFSVDEKSQIQALDRTQPILPLRPGIPERQTHDYQRHGTTTLFAALNVLDGTVIGHCLPRHRHSEFLAFLDKLDHCTPRRRQIHLILDNYATHTHPRVKQWLAGHPRYHLHFTPKGASWMNLVERWFAEITRKRIRRGTFGSVRELQRAIHAYIRENNTHPKPFTWTASPTSIIRKVRHCKDTSEAGH